MPYVRNFHLRLGKRAPELDPGTGRRRWVDLQVDAKIRVEVDMDAVAFRTRRQGAQQPPQAVKGAQRRRRRDGNRKRGGRQWLRDRQCPNLT